MPSSNKNSTTLYDSWVYWMPQEEKSLTKACTCGTNVTMGYEAPNEFHSYYCDLVRENDKDDDSKTS